jgi:acetyltransferase-like isoleucine patch superfamily enzyme
MNLVKKYFKYFYFNSYKKKLNVHLTANLDSHSSYGENSTFQKNTLIASSKIGANVTIQENTVIKRSELADFVNIHNDCKMNGSSVGSYSYVAKSSEISYTNIGKFCSIGAEVWIGVGKHPPNFISTSPVFYSTLKKQLGFSFSDKQLYEEFSRCTIGNDVWIGSRVMILDGISVGDGAIIAANSVVTKDVAPYSIVGGTPAKLIKPRFDDATIEKLLQEKWWDWNIEDIKKKLPFFQKEINRVEDLF